MSDVVDDEVLQRLRDLGGQSLVRRLVALFEENVPARLEAAQSGLAAGDLAAVEQAVHSMKSSAGNVGAYELMDLAEAAEVEAEQGRGQRLPDLLVQIEAALTAIRARLATEMESDD